MDDAGVLPRRQVRLSPQTAWEQISTLASGDGGEPLADSDTGLFGDFELNRSAGLLLEVAAPQLAVYGQIEHREITFAAL
jgi:hypothetical protein